MANLNEFFAKIPSFPFNNYRSKFPAKISPQGFVFPAIVILKPPNQSRWITDTPPITYNRKISNFLRHHKPSFL